MKTIALLPFLLIGCSVTPGEIERAELLCVGHGGWVVLFPDTTHRNHIEVVCKDRTKFEVTFK